MHTQAVPSTESLSLVGYLGSVKRIAACWCRPVSVTRDLPLHELRIAHLVLATAQSSI